VAPKLTFARLALARLGCTGCVEVDLPPEIETRLEFLAHQRGIDAEALARTAIEHFVDHDAWFVREVDKGLAQIDGGRTLTHEAVGLRLEQYLTEKHSRS
jgi:predicted transcriptional regulator